VDDPAGGALPSLNDSNWRAYVSGVVGLNNVDESRKKGRYPLLVGKKLIIFDPVSGGFDTVNHNSHDF
jgi:hypothetical protein